MDTLYIYYKETQTVCTDTRTMEKDCLFFCLSGEHFDGNAFAEEALSKGAKYVVIDNPAYKLGDVCICVPNSLAALQQLAAHHRDCLQIPVVGITGTNGKTTTKELVHAVLSEKYRVTAAKGNLNNHIGVPLTLLSIKPDTDIALIEMGANHAGEIAFLCEIAKPNYGIITNIGKAHLEGFGSVENIIQTKSALYKYVKQSNGTLFVNADDALLMDLSKETKRLTYGKSGDCCGVLNENDLQMAFQISDYPRTITTQLTGSYNFYNAMAAAAVGKYFSVPMDKIAHALSAYTPDNSRSQIVRKGSYTLILDAYNANPSSMKLAIENIAGMNAENKVLLLGGMAELGGASTAEHQSIVDLIRTFSFDYVYLFGDEFAKTNADISWIYTDSEQLQTALKSTLPDNVTVLIKGSRSMGMEQYADALLKAC
ncbi:MAG: UDP-N-acetylmuramoyl-tripeptide--D-alanyl-D-alanine ligase [Lentimicrobiaceae bacterium]|nr:UDP-N-acetylmuramoyl-tripeptide--D-alanyl-D-alanine ligase [Lentimicrobiaceae bacterium]